MYLNGNVFLGATMWDVYTNGNILLGLTVWDIHTNGNVFLGLTVWNVHTNGNVCLGMTVCDVLTTGTDWACIIVFDRSPVAHDLILCSVCDRRAYHRQFLGRVGKTPLSPTLTWRKFQMPSRKSVKNHLYSTSLY